MQLNVFGRTAIVAWDLPTDDMGDDVPVDVRVDFDFPSSIGAFTYIKVPVSHSPIVDSLLTQTLVDYDYLSDILVDNLSLRTHFGIPPGETITLERFGPFKIFVKIRRSDQAQGWTQEQIDKWNNGGESSPTPDPADAVTIELDYPFRSESELEVQLPPPTDMRVRKVGSSPGAYHALEWYQPYWLGTPRSAADVSSSPPLASKVYFLNLWWQTYQTAVGNLHLDPQTRQIEVVRYEYRYKGIEELQWRPWKTVDNSINSGYTWAGFTTGASVRTLVQAYPRGEGGARDRLLQTGIYFFEGRAVTREGVRGSVISTRVTIDSEGDIV